MVLVWDWDCVMTMQRTWCCPGFLVGLGWVVFVDNINIDLRGERER